MHTSIESHRFDLNPTRFRCLLLDQLNSQDAIAETRTNLVGINFYRKRYATLEVTELTFTAFPA
tara:strand:- start:199 stop:390 length:192 start_codon:yes stop_codon:yes gene_type:complete